MIIKTQNGFSLNYLRLQTGIETNKNGFAEIDDFNQSVD